MMAHSKRRVILSLGELLTLPPSNTHQLIKSKTGNGVWILPLKYSYDSTAEENDTVYLTEKMFDIDHAHIVSGLLQNAGFNIELQSYFTSENYTIGIDIASEPSVSPNVRCPICGCADNIITNRHNRDTLCTKCDYRGHFDNFIY